MALREFLETRKTGRATASERTKEYAEAVETLMLRLKKILTPFERLTVEEWLPLLREAGVTYNAPALTVIVDDDQITIEPLGAYVIGSKGRVRMTCGVRQVHLDWAGADEWTFRWVTPRTTERMDLTDAAVEEIVQGLLS